jgi:hypothetical protein
MSRHPVTPADRRFLRSLPMTLLFQQQRGQPERMFTQFPQLRRLLKNKLISASYDASLNAVTINRGAALDHERRRILGAAAEEVEATEFLLAPPEPTRSAT